MLMLNYVVVRVAWVCVPWEPQVTRVLWWTILDNVEAAHVWVHRFCTGAQGIGRVQKGVPAGIHPDHRVRQQAPSPVHQFHCLQAYLSGLRLRIYPPVWGPLGFLSIVFRSCLISFSFSFFLPSNFRFGCFVLGFPMKWMRSI